jgi:hypothetical protein
VAKLFVVEKKALNKSGQIENMLKFASLAKYLS